MIENPATTYRTLAEPSESKPMTRFLAARRLALNLLAKYPTTAEELVRDMSDVDRLGDVIEMIASRENLSEHELAQIGSEER